MRRQIYFFDFRFEISVKFRVEWYILIYDLSWICQCSLYFVHIHAYANTYSRESVGKFNMNHIVLYIIRRGILRWFRFWSQKNISAYAFKRKSRFKKFAWADQKNFGWSESGIKFWFEIYPYVMKLNVTSSRIVDGQKIDYAS